GKRVWSRQGELSGLSSTPAEEPVGGRPAADQVTGWRIRPGNWPVQILTEKYHSSAWSHRLKDFVAQIEVVEESRGCMHAGNPEDGVAEGDVYFHDQLPQSMRLRDLGGDVESGKGDGNPLEPGTEHRRGWNRDEERIKREMDELRGRSHPSRHR